MNCLYGRTPRLTPTGIATASILLLSLLMAASLFLDQPNAQASASVVVQTTAHANG
jgi:hypothetical protein